MRPIERHVVAIRLGGACGIIGKPVGQFAKALQLSHKTVRSRLLPLASWSAVSCGNVRMLVLVFLVVAVLPAMAMARDLCQLGECKCSGVVASCSGPDIKVDYQTLFIFDRSHPFTQSFLLSWCPPS